MTDEKEPKHGGPRPGAGRPKAPASVLLRIRVTPAHMAAIQERGGDIWLKRIINEAIERDSHSPAR